MKKTEYEPFKYFMQDTSKLYIGAKYSYGEIVDNESAPSKVKKAVMQYMLKEAGADITIENHIFSLKETDISYFAYKQMKAKFKINVWNEKRETYESRICTIKEIMHNEKLRKANAEGKAVVEELAVKKTSIMMLGI